VLTWPRCCPAMSEVFQYPPPFMKPPPQRWVTLPSNRLTPPFPRVAQAERELGPQWTLMKALEKGVPTVEKWLVTNLPEVRRRLHITQQHNLPPASCLHQSISSYHKLLVDVMSAGCGGGCERVPDLGGAGAGVAQGVRGAAPPATTPRAGPRRRHLGKPAHPTRCSWR
jgi:hypothetical protein